MTGAQALAVLLFVGGIGVFTFLLVCLMDTEFAIKVGRSARSMRFHWRSRRDRPDYTILRPRSPEKPPE